jgi:exoribonuclease R
MGRTTTLEYSEKNVREVIALNAQGISFPALANVFELKDEKALLRLRGTIEVLVNEGFATKSRRDQYQATKPLSDLVVARVGESLVSRDHKINLTIEGIKGDFPYSVTLNRKQIKKFPGMTLNEGDLVAVVLNRFNGSELKARLHGKLSEKKPLTIAGKFSNAGGEVVFTPYDSGISTIFKTFGRPVGDINPKASYTVAIPASLDPFDPALERLEQKWDPDTGVPISEIIASKHGVSVKPDDIAFREAKAALRREPLLYGRRDLRNEKIMVVDPLDARDHDDGIMVERTSYGYRTLVVIADVPFYVRPETHLDEEAKARGFTHYLKDDTFHMLPHTLVKGTSLKSGELRPVVYVEQFWDEHGELFVDQTEIGTGLIQSQMQFSYGKFEDLILSDNLLVEDYKTFGEVLLDRMRHKRKGIIFESDELEETSTFSKSLVAGMMMEGNIAIAEFLNDRNVPHLNRVHSAMDNPFALEEAAEQLSSWGYDIDSPSQLLDAMELRRIMDDADGRREKDLVENFFKANLLHRAHYSTRNTGHFTLQVGHYTHATSPIRRYADIVTLRAVHTALGDHELGLSDADISYMERTANSLNYLQDLDRRIHLDMQKYYAVRDLFRLEGHTARAQITRIEPRHGFEIVLPERQGLRKVISPDNLPEGWKMGVNKSLIFNERVAVGEGSTLRLKIKDVRPHEAEWGFDSMEPVAVRKAPLLAFSTRALG